MAVDYALVLAIINSDDNPAAALESFVNQERENAAHQASALGSNVIVVPSDQYARLMADD